MKINRIYGTMNVSMNLITTEPSDVTNDAVYTGNSPKIRLFQVNYYSLPGMRFAGHLENNPTHCNWLINVNNTD